MTIGKDRKKRMFGIKYHKISHKIKMLLLKKVLCDKMQIKEAAQILDLNYSTAKTLMRKYKPRALRLDSEVLQGIANWYDAYEIPRLRCLYHCVDLSERKRLGLLQTTCNSAKKNILEVSFGQRDDGDGNKQQCEVTTVKIIQQVLFKE